MKKIWQIALAIVVAVAAIVVLSYVITDSRSDAPNPETAVIQSAEISLTIEGLYDQKPVSITTNETVLELLRKLNVQDPQLQLATKDYAGLGTIVEGLGGRRNGIENKYWQYRVGGVMPQIGADQFRLNGGEKIEWFFGPSEF